MPPTQTAMPRRCTASTRPQRIGCGRRLHDGLSDERMPHYGEAPPSAKPVCSPGQREIGAADADATRRPAAVRPGRDGGGGPARGDVAALLHPDAQCRPGSGTRGAGARSEQDAGAVRARRQWRRRLRGGDAAGPAGLARRRGGAGRAASGQRRGARAGRLAWTGARVRPGSGGAGRPCDRCRLRGRAEQGGRRAGCRGRCRGRAGC